ncbi:MAG: hypothetical protein LUG58_05410 [Clostridiales bacterium]|nr:hypothetical protein [Clostridiales bacterium]
MSKKTTDIVAYLTWIGLVVAFVAGDRQRSKFHLNQALVLALIGVVWNVVYRIVYWIVRIVTFGLLTGILGALNAVVELVLLVFTIWGLVNAIQDVEKPLPLIGGIVLYR